MNAVASCHAHFPARLRSAISASGSDITTVAYACGWQPSHLSRLLAGQAEPSYSSIVLLLQALPATDARWLLLGNGGEP